MKIAIINLAFHTNTPTGGDTIAIESAKRWMLMDHEVTIVTTKSGAEYCVSHGFPKKSIRIIPFSSFDVLGYEISILFKTLCSPVAVLLLSGTYDVYFASSFFLPDSIPAFLLKLLHPTSTLLTSIYVYTRRFFGYEYSGGKAKGFFFWIHEAFAVKCVQLLKGYVLTSSLYDAQELIKLTGFSASQVHAVGGGVDINTFSSIPFQTPRYDAVFVGRFKPQKCIDILLEIWKKIIESKPDWKLAIIGGGPLEQSLRVRSRLLGISHAISFLGVLDGVEKIRILKSSRMFVSASLYDTGNIALDEAQACSLPGIIFDLPSMPYDTGVVHVKVGDLQGFANAILSVGTDSDLYSSLSEGAKQYAESIDWNIRAKEIIAFIQHSSR